MICTVRPFLPAKRDPEHMLARRESDVRPRVAEEFALIVISPPLGSDLNGDCLLIRLALGNRTSRGYSVTGATPQSEYDRCHEKTSFLLTLYRSIRMIPIECR